MTQAILTVSNLITEAIYGFTDLMKTWKRNRARKAMIARTYNELSQRIIGHVTHSGTPNIFFIASGNLVW